jgi:RNA polymerase sigma factor (sigma-70 family)
VKKDKRKKEQQILDEFIRHGRVDGVVREYWNLIYYTVRATLAFYNMPHTKEDIEDLRAEVFIHLFENDYRRLRQYDPARGLSLSGWIRLMANQRILNEISKKGLLDVAKRNFKLQIEDIEAMLIYDEDKRLEAREKLKITIAVIEKLEPGDSKEVLRQHLLEFKSLREIAASMNKQYGAVATMLSRAKEKLEDSIQEIFKAREI